MDSDTVAGRATSRVDAAIFYLSSPRLIHALCRLAEQPGITTRVVVDSAMDAAANRPLLEQLANAGVQVAVANMPAGAKMHLRCAVIDDRLLLTGAANWSDAADQSNYEDLLCLESPELASKYRRRIDELISAGRTVKVGNAPTAARTARPIRPIPWAANPDRVERIVPHLYEEDRVVESLVAQLKSASRVDVAMYMLTNPTLIGALKEAAGRASVRLLMDAEALGATGLATLQDLWNAGVRIHLVRKDRATMHLKAAVIDGKQVWTGSANWTVNAMQRNAEDILRMESALLAEQYLRFFDQIESTSNSFADEALPDSRDAGVADSSFHPNLPRTGPRRQFDDLARQPFPAITDVAKVAYVPDHTYTETLIRMIRSTRQTLLILMYSFPEVKGDAPFQRTVLRELEQAVKRGVYVYMLLYTPYSNKDRLAEHHGNRAEQLRRIGVDVRLAPPGTPQHAKTVIADQVHLLVGSQNWSEGALSAERVHESSVLVSLRAPDVRLADYVFSRKTISDMRSRAAWEGEITALRHVMQARGNQRDALVAKLESELEEP